MAFRLQKMFANFNNCQYLELLYNKKGKPEYICLRTEKSLKKGNFVSTCTSLLYFTLIYLLSCYLFNGLMNKCMYYRITYLLFSNILKTVFERYLFPL